MNQEQLKTFLEKAKSNHSLQEKLKAASDIDAIAEIAKAAGFVVSTDALKKAQSKLSDQELESVAGGGPDIDELLVLKANLEIAKAQDLVTAQV